MKEPKILDYILLTILALIWSSAFFNIKIATYSYGPVTIAFLRTFFGAIPVIGLCLVKKIKIVINEEINITKLKDYLNKYKDSYGSEVCLSVDIDNKLVNISIPGKFDFFNIIFSR